MSDYLWDREGQTDPDVERLEGLLGRFRQELPAPDFGAVPRRAATPPRRVGRGWLAAAAALAACALVAGWVASREQAATLRVARLAGAPRVGDRSIAQTGTLRAGEDLVTDAASRARIDIGMIGEVEVDPLSRIGLVAARPTEHRLTLRVGTLHARIWAPPRRFFVNTPSATAIDLGCAYTLTVDAAGVGHLTVTKGWVAFEYEGRESFVPEGAMCTTRPVLGPGTPYRTDASVSLRDALDRFDGERDPAALTDALAAAGEKDALSLWHLLPRTTGERRGLVYDRLAAFVPPPAGVTREAILAGDREMLDRWWKELGLGSASWWRLWKGPPPRVS
jgi:ferric-dicitrate binding protein FerR (iron transport regulator)